jgi:hypothetical protein
MDVMMLMMTYITMPATTHAMTLVTVHIMMPTIMHKMVHQTSDGWADIACRGQLSQLVVMFMYSCS